MQLKDYKRVITITIIFSFHLMSTSSVFAVTYGTYENPFSADSFWNMPIHDGATYRDAQINESHRFYTEKIRFIRPSSSDKARSVVSVTPTREAPFYGGKLCQSKANYKSPVASWQLPDDLIANTQVSNSIAVYYYNGQFQEGALFERCSRGGRAAVAWTPSETYSVKGHGMPKRGMQLGTRLGAVGGTIRKGELSSAPGVPIPHTLKVLLDHNSTKGVAWPAPVSDGHGGRPSAKFLRGGSLLAFPPSMTTGQLGLKTEPGKKIFYAFQTYGGVVVDHACRGSDRSCWDLGFEIDKYGVKVVENELKAMGLKTNSGPFKADLDAILRNLHVVTNNSAKHPKGPGLPLPTGMTANIFITLTPPEELRVMR